MRGSGSTSNIGSFPSDTFSFLRTLPPRKEEPWRPKRIVTRVRLMASGIGARPAQRTGRAPKPLMAWRSGRARDCAHLDAADLGVWVHLVRFMATGNAAHAIVRAIVDEFEDNVLEDYEKEIG